MTEQEMYEKFWPIPPGCEVTVLDVSVGFMVILVVDVADVRLHVETFIPPEDYAYVSAYRDRNFHDIWVRVRSRLRLWELPAMYWAFYPYSKMRLLNRATF